MGASFELAQSVTFSTGLQMFKFVNRARKKVLSGANEKIYLVFELYILPDINIYIYEIYL